MSNRNLSRLLRIVCEIVDVQTYGGLVSSGGPYRESGLHTNKWNAALCEIGCFHFESQIVEVPERLHQYLHVLE